MASTLNKSTDLELPLLNLAQKDVRSQFHIDTTEMRADGTLTRMEILNTFKIGILKTAKDNIMLDNLLKFFHEVLIVEKWGDVAPVDAEDSHDDVNLSSDSNNDGEYGSDETTKIQEETEIVGVYGNSCNSAASFDSKDSPDAEREIVIYCRRTVHQEHFTLLSSQGNFGNIPPNSYEIEGTILAADENTICRLPFAALAKRRPDILRICFQADVDMNTFFEPRGHNLLKYSVSLPSVEISTFDLLLHGIDVQTRTPRHERTVLTECLANSKMASELKITIVRKLLNAGITMECSSRFFSSPLHVYVNAMISSENFEDNCRDIIDILMKAGNDVNAAANFDGITPLMSVIEIIAPDDTDLPEALNDRNISIAGYLLEKGADPEIRDFDGKSSIFYAVLTQNTKLLKLVLKYSTNASIQDNMGMTAICKACSFIEGPYDDRDIDTILVSMLEALAAAGCDVNLEAIDMTTALHHSAEKQPIKICETLCKLGAATNKRDYLKRTPLHLAARNEDTNVIKILLKYGADIDACDINNETPLHHACIFDNTEAAKMLVNAGANVEAQSVLGIRPLHLAAESGSKDTVEYLMSIADHSAKDIYGAQVLHYAAADGNTEIIEYLLHSGIDKKQCDHNGMSALDFARYMGHLKSAQLLHGSESVQFGNLPPGCFPYGPLLEISQVDEYYKNISEQFANEITIRKTKPTETARMLLTSKGLGSVTFDSEEAKVISDLITKYADALAKRIGELDPLFQCTVLRAGSTFEGVKMGYPDEFDFLCDLTAFQQYVEEFEQGDTEGFARVLLKEKIPDMVKRFCSGTIRYINSSHIIRHFSQLALQAKFDVLSQENFRGHIHSGSSMLPDTHLLFTRSFVHLSLNSERLSFRGSQHKHLCIDIDFNPAIFSTKYPHEANIQCRLLPNVSSRGIYVIPKLCNVLNEFTSEDNKNPLEEHWRFSTQHIEAEVMQRMPQIALDGYMVCKILRMEPLSCSVKYLDFDGAFLSEEQLRKLLPHEKTIQGGEIETDSSTSEDDNETEGSANELENMEDVIKSKSESMEADAMVENESDTKIAGAATTITKDTEEQPESSVTPNMNKTSLMNVDELVSYQAIKDEQENESIADDVIELTPEKVIPSYYIKSIFIKEMERMALDGEELSEESIVKIPRRVYQQLQKAIDEGCLRTLFMPHHNMLKKTNEPNASKIITIREMYCNNILRLMDSLGFN